MFLIPFIQDNELRGVAKELLADIRASRFESVLRSECARSLLGSGNSGNEPPTKSSTEGWTARVRSRIASKLILDHDTQRETRQQILLVGLAALHALLQANVTGPPLAWRLEDVCLSDVDESDRREVKQTLIANLSEDGEAAYHLTPHIELFSIAHVLITEPAVCVQETPFVWARLRVNFVHQQLLNEISPTIQAAIYQDISVLDSSVLGSTSTFDSDVKVLYLLERAAINTLHGFDKKAKEDIAQATELRRFQYVLTGRLGKRTKFQQTDISQLVVLAKSYGQAPAEIKGEIASGKTQNTSQTSKPQNLDLNDDTLLESISFTELNSNPRIIEDVPTALANLDPANQPVLEPLDAIILLSLASSITNTSPQDGLTREETLPYATRVLEGGSTNWQIYTQALLLRSRIEGYKSRTVERGVLQMQVLVDQIIAETKGSGSNNANTVDSSATFLPQPKNSESAPASERLLYLYQLASPFTWTLEAELASRWVALGGLRTALEIFERLEMWAEAALCWAATEREDRACQIVRRQLYQQSNTESISSETDGVKEEYEGNEVSALPNDAPRLFCILGDIEKEPKHYERAWEISNKRYARAQRSLGKHYLKVRDLDKADEAYSKSLSIHPQNAPAWFALGCIRLETMDWKGAVHAFSRCVQVEDEDAEAWSNLAVALLRMPVDQEIAAVPSGLDEELVTEKVDPQKHKKEAFVALKRATAIKRDSYRIWQNVLNVAATLTPPPYSDIIIAQQRLIELRSKTEGEGCVDTEVLEGILAHVIAMGESTNGANGTDTAEPTRAKHGLEKMLSDLIQKQVIPLITQSRRLWQLVAKLAIHQNRLSSALDAYEKAWRATLNKPGWDDGSTAAGSVSNGSNVSSVDKAWEKVKDSTIELVDAYESLGEKEVTEGLGTGSGELVCKNWRYKARMAIKTVSSRRTKAGFEDLEMLTERIEALKS